MNDPQELVDEVTKEAERQEWDEPHTSDRSPTDEEEELAPAAASPGVAEHYEEMAELGANVKGEGRIV